jgi:hypothetical protein
MTAIPITPLRVLGGNGAHPVTRRLLEDAGETFLQGTPVVVQDSDGYLIESPTISSALTIAGFSQQEARNRASDGVVEHTTEGTVPFQTNAQVIPGGARPDDGRIGVWIANSQTEFVAAFYATATAAIPTQADIGNIFGLTKQSNGFWAIDSDITAAASGAICLLTEILNIPGDPLAPATPIAGQKVAFKITAAGQQFNV